MKKTLALTVLLLVVFAIGFATTNTPLTTPVGPRVIAKVSLTNQTTAIPTTTLFTPQQSGLYRISAYMTMTAPVTNGNYLWVLPLTWTDDAGTETAFLAQLPTASVPPSDFAASASGTPDCTVVIRALAGTPVTYYTYPSVAGGTYALFLVAERLD